MIDRETSPSGPASPVSRRRFLERSSLAVAGAAGAAAAAELAFPAVGRAAPNLEIRVGLIGCGGRGTGAALNILRAPTKVIYPPPRHGYHTENAAEGARAQAKDVRVTALADLFPERLEACRGQLRKVGNEVPGDRCFTGLDAREKLLALADVNYVILATPPHFRPAELRAAVEAGKHVFMEKPVAVDGPGVRSVIESGEIAMRKGLGVLAGTQRRHEANHFECVKRLRDGAIGQILEGRAYFNIGEIWMIPREPGWSDMEWQLRNWPYFTWLSGDIIVEQHIHMIDMMNWIMGSHPLRAYGMGARQARPSKEYGHIYDQFFIEYEYPGGARVFSQNRQIEGCADNVSNAVTGTKGSSNCQTEITGERPWRFGGEVVNPYEQEHLDLIESIRAGKPLNEARAVAESTLTAIMGRESAYSGQVIEWDAALRSKRDLSPGKIEFGDLPIPEVAIPGKYRFS